MAGMNLSGILSSMLEVAQAAAPIIGHGAPEAIALGKSVVAMIDQVKENMPFTDEADAGMGELIARRDEIEARVNAHVDQTVGRLRGD